MAAIRCGMLKPCFPTAGEIRLFTGEQRTANIRFHTRFGCRETGRTSAGRDELVHLARWLEQNDSAGSGTWASETGPLPDLFDGMLAAFGQASSDTRSRQSDKK